MASEITIRRARPSDAVRIAELSGELGYPATDVQIRERLRRLLSEPAHAIFVAELPDGRVIGWLHASVLEMLDSETRVEVHALIVADGHRSAGTGTQLLEAAEQWARMQGCKQVNLRCNVIRDRAHSFYLRQGYDHYKTQKAFRKML